MFHLDQFAVKTVTHVVRIPLILSANFDNEKLLYEENVGFFPKYFIKLLKSFSSCWFQVDLSLFLIQGGAQLAYACLSLSLKFWTFPLKKLSVGVRSHQQWFLERDKEVEIPKVTEILCHSLMTTWTVTYYIHSIL